MHRVALLGLLLTVCACSTPDLSAHDPSAIPNFEGTGFAKFIDDTHTFATNPNLPDSDALNTFRVEAVTASVEPLTTENGTIWPGPPEPIKSLRDLQMETNPAMAPEPRMPNSRQLGDGASGGAYTPTAKAPPSSAPSTSGSAIVLNNADGSKTIIYPDGRVELKPAPK